MTAKMPRNLRLAGVFAITAALCVLPAYGAVASDGGVSVSNNSHDGDEEYIATSESDSMVWDDVASDAAPLSRSVSAQTVNNPFIGTVHADNAHVSGLQASGHVWWKLESGTNRKLRVTSLLKARTSWFTFRNMVAPVEAYVYAGGGRGRVAAARYNCRNFKERDWYTYGEIFAPGSTKSFGYSSSNITPIKCDGGLS